MPLPKHLTKAAAVSVCIILLTVFVAYRSGIFAEHTATPPTLLPAMPGTGYETIIYEGTNVMTTATFYDSVPLKTTAGERP